MKCQLKHKLREVTTRVTEAVTSGSPDQQSIHAISQPIELPDVNSGLPRTERVVVSKPTSREMDPVPLSPNDLAVLGHFFQLLDRLDQAMATELRHAA
jgi:hypothetical protein